MRHDISPECHVVSTPMQSMYPCLLFALCTLASASCLEGSPLIIIFSFTHKGSQAPHWPSRWRALLELGWAGFSSCLWVRCLLPPLPEPELCHCLHGKGATAQQTRAPGEAVRTCSLSAGNIQTTAAWGKGMHKINPSKLRREKSSPTPHQISY